MTKAFFSLCILAICFSVSKAQSPISPVKAKSISLDLGGPGFLAILYDQRFKAEKGAGFRAGIGFIPGVTGNGGSAKAVFTFPFEINYLLGAKGNYAEFGIGMTALTGFPFGSGSPFYKVGSTQMIGHGTLGYRFQTLKKEGFLFRIFLSPLFVKDGIFPAWAGISLGYKF